MRYSREFIIPANTPADSPYQERIKLNTGVLRTVLVRFRAGCHNRVSFRVLDGQISIVPASEGLYLYGDDVTFSIPMNYRMDYKPYELILEGVSPGSAFDHILSVSMDVDELDEQNKQTVIDALEWLNEVNG